MTKNDFSVQLILDNLRELTASDSQNFRIRFILHDLETIKANEDLLTDWERNTFLPGIAERRLNHNGEWCPELLTVVEFDILQDIAEQVQNR